MSRITDIPEIRTLLRADPVWSAYALCDLGPELFPKTAWFTPDLTLVLHEYGTCILFAVGRRSLDEALGHVSWPCHLQVQDDAFDLLEVKLGIANVRTMWRMRWSHRASPRSGLQRPSRLGPADVPLLQRLYADGETAGEAPDFFMPSTVADGTYFGIREEGALVAAAGTHVLSREEGAAAIGNVYTRRDRRGRGYGRAVIGAVLGTLAGIETVVLNVRTDNVAAIRVYESLGFERHCRFREALATGWLAAATREEAGA